LSDRSSVAFKKKPRPEFTDRGFSLNRNQTETIDLIKTIGFSCPGPNKGCFCPLLSYFK
jgi:hypothetical protein